MDQNQNIACVLGDMDLVRALGIARVPCAVSVPPGAAPRFSRFTHMVLDWAHPWTQPAQLVETLVRFGKSQSKPPVLYFQSDGELLLISRNRELLAKHFRFAIAEPELIEDLVDKARFQRLAERIGLPVPRARRLSPGYHLEESDLRYPIILKPLTRRPDIWKTVAPQGKAMRIDSPAEFRRLWSQLSALNVEMLAQELIPGPESSIESYHVYVDGSGEILGEFTGKKIRTYPIEYGDSCALITTDAADVATLGRELVQRLSLRGVAKFDFKRAPNGQLYLLEVNPRFNLWHHLGALAGVNLPELAYHDLTGQPKPQAKTAVAGVRWCRAWQDVLAARQSNIKTISWLRWTISCDAKRMLAWDDPMPIIGGACWRVMDFMKKALGGLRRRLHSYFVLSRVFRVFGGSNFLQHKNDPQIAPNTRSNTKGVELDFEAEPNSV